MSHRSLATLINGGMVSDCFVILMVVEELLPPVLFMENSSMVFAPSLRVTSAAQVVRQSNETAS